MPVTLKSLRYLDPSGRCALIGKFWPEFPELVIAQFDAIWEANQSDKHRAGHRWEAFRSRAKPSLPEPPHYGWEKEIFEVCFQTVLGDLPAELWKRGEPSSSTLESAGSIAIPQVRMDISLELSRGPRPPIVPPRDLSDAVTEPQTIAGEEEFEGWYRIGYCEDELINESFDSEGRASYVDAYCGLVAAKTAEEVADVRIPLAQGKNLPLWADVDEEIGAHLPRLTGGLVCGFFQHGFTWRGMILAAHPVVVAGLGLGLGVWPSQLQLVDTKNRRALVLRIWRTNAVEADTVGQVYRLQGCDLLLRPDLFDALAFQASSPMFVVSRVSPSSDNSNPRPVG